MDNANNLKIVYTCCITYVAAMFAYLNIDQELISIYSILLLLDLLTGISAAMIENEIITKKRFVAGILSKLVMFVVPITVALLVKMRGIELLWFTKWTLIVLGASEAISILNNVLKSKGKKQLPEIDAITIVSNKIRIILERLFDTEKGK